jgi:O-antigen ligase
MKGIACLILLIGLAVSSLTNVHVQPQTVVYAEWIAALTGVLGFCIFALGTAEQPRLRLSFAPLLILLLIGVCLVWQARIPGMGYTVYAGFFLLCYLQGAQTDVPLLAPAVAAGLLMCAWLQSLAGLAQLAGWSLGGLVMQKIYLQAFGNIGQANHYADLVFLGLASLCYLYARNAMRLLSVALVALVLAVWLALAAAASASRGSLLYILAFFVLGGLALWRGDEEGRRTGRVMLLVALVSVAAQLLVTYGHILNAFGVTTALDRAGDAGSNGQRLYNWGAAWQAIQAHPWIGQGPATFYKASIDAMFTTAPASFPKFAEHAHNLLLNMAAELGAPVAIILLGGFLWWYLRHLLARLTAPRLWALACIAVVGLHSMVEYPLWYTYFLAPVGLCVGVADAQDGRLPLFRLPRVLGGCLATLAVVVLAWTAHDWLAVHNAYETLADGEPDTTYAMRATARAELKKVSPYSVFALHAETLRIQSWHSDEGGAEKIASRCDAHWQYKPGWYMMMRCSEAYAQADREAALRRIAMALCDGFPGYRGDLNQWAAGYDADDWPGLSLRGHACLK